MGWWCCIAGKAGQAVEKSSPPCISCHYSGARAESTSKHGQICLTILVCSTYLGGFSVRVLFPVITVPVEYSNFSDSPFHRLISLQSYSEIHSIICICFLLLSKAKWNFSSQVFLLGGSHESSCLSSSKAFSGVH